jgi:succinate dehydrogenase / fumarate reductase flavoprotein subunit
VYLDLTERATGIKREVLEHKLGAILEIYEKFVGTDPLDEPMRIFPAVHYSMGGIWVGFAKDETTGGLVAGSPANHRTSIPGLYAIGECDYQYHGANRLGANSLLSCIFSGLFVAPCIHNWLDHLPAGSAEDQPAGLWETETKKHIESYKTLIARDGDENPYLLHRELGELMTRNVTVVRDNRELTQTLDELEKLERRAARAALSDKSTWTNQNLSFTRALSDMIVLARVITQGALQRDECRGAHYKPEFEIPAPTSDEPGELETQAHEWCRRYYDQANKWLKTTKARHTPDGPELTYEPVDTLEIPPRPRTYGVRGAEIIERVWRDSFLDKARTLGQPARAGAAEDAAASVTS